MYILLVILVCSKNFSSKFSPLEFSSSEFSPSKVLYCSNNSSYFIKRTYI